MRMLEMNFDTANVGVNSFTSSTCIDKKFYSPFNKENRGCMSQYPILGPCLVIHPLEQAPVMHQIVQVYTVLAP